MVASPAGRPRLMSVGDRRNAVLTRDGCQQRQERFRDLLARLQLAAAVVSDPRDVYYLTGFVQPGSSFPMLLYVATDGESWLAAHTPEGDALVDDRVTYEPSTLATLNPDPLRRLALVAGAR